MFSNVINIHVSLQSHLMPCGEDGKFLSLPFYCCGNRGHSYQEGELGLEPSQQTHSKVFYTGRLLQKGGRPSWGGPYPKFALAYGLLGAPHSLGGGVPLPSPPATRPWAPLPSPRAPTGCPSGLGVNHMKEGEMFLKDCPEKCFLFPGDIFDTR